MKKSILLVTLTLLLAFTGIAQADQQYDYNVNIYVQGQLISIPDQKPFLEKKSGRTYVPIRFVSEALGAKVDWLKGEQKIVITDGSKSISLTIGSTKVVVGGKAQTIDAPAKLMNGRTMVPLRFISQVLGQEVNWVAGKNGNKVEIAAKNANSGSSLNENIIKKLFSSRINEDGFNYELDQIRWQEGPFTGHNAREAIVSFSDGSQCHASLFGEVWLLSYNNGWKIKGQLLESDFVNFEVVDLQKDGLSEVWLTAERVNQGYAVTYGCLLAGSSQQKGSLKRVYEVDGFNYTGAGEEGEVFLTHNVKFKDVDGDGILELVDLVEKKSFAWTGEQFISDYVETSSTRKELVVDLEKLIK